MYNSIAALLSTAPEATMDASGRLRTSQTYTLGDYKVLNSSFDTKVMEQNGTATFTVNANSVTMTVAAGQYGIITSKQYHPYFNGKSQLVEMTTVGMGAAADLEKSFGYISSVATGTFSTGLDGFRLFKALDNSYSIQIWRNGIQLVTTSLNRANWIDPLDGTGPSGMTIDFNNFNVFAFDFLYLGGTSLRCFVNYEGQFILFAQYNYANTDTQPFLFSPNKPLRWEIRSTTGAGSLTMVCGSVISEGQGLELLGAETVVKGPTAGIATLAAGTTYAFCGVRKGATYRDIFATVDSFNGVVSTSNDFIDWELRLNPTVAGVFTYSALSGTPLETATGAITNTVTGGFSLSNIYGSSTLSAKAVSVNNRLTSLNSTLNNTMDTIVLCGTPSLGSTNIKGTGSMSVRYLSQ